MIRRCAARKMRNKKDRHDQCRAERHDHDVGPGGGHGVHDRRVVTPYRDDALHNAVRALEREILADQATLGRVCADRLGLLAGCDERDLRLGVGQDGLEGGRRGRRASTLS